jgi:2-phosphosulfolactate phosphatase
VLPFPWADPAGAAAHAAANDAVVAGRREDGGWSLSPTDLARIPPGTRLVLPSPNGSAIAFAAADLGLTVVAGCLRNAPAAAETALVHAGDGAIAVIAAGERAQEDPSSLRVAVEDLTGAGAVLASLPGDRADGWSPEARAAVETFESAAGDLEGWLLACGSGRELVAIGWTDDVLAAAAFDVDGVAPVLRHGVFGS